MTKASAREWPPASDAPSDGKIYGRQDGAWAPVPDPAAAPQDGKIYGVQNGQWKAIEGTGSAAVTGYDGTVSELPPPPPLEGEGNEGEQPASAHMKAKTHGVAMSRSTGE